MHLDSFDHLSHLQRLLMTQDILLKYLFVFIHVIHVLFQAIVQVIYPQHHKLILFLKDRALYLKVFCEKYMRRLLLLFFHYFFEFPNHKEILLKLLKVHCVLSIFDEQFGKILALLVDKTKILGSLILMIIRLVEL